MRSGRILILLVLIVAGCISIGVLFFAYIRLEGRITQPAQAAFTEVYMAAKDIPKGTVITQEMLTTFSIPSENTSEVMFTIGEEDALVGHVARYTMEQGTVIISSMVETEPP